MVGNQAKSTKILVARKFGDTLVIEQNAGGQQSRIRILTNLSYRQESLY